MKNPVILNAYHYAAQGQIVRDRFILTLVLAAGLHAVVILGVAFEWRPQAVLGKRFDVVFINTQSEKAPKHAQRYAAANQRGGGQDGEPQVPQTITEAMVPINEFRLSEVMPTPSTQAAREQEDQQRVLTSVDNLHSTASSDNPRRGEAQKLTAAELYSRSMEIASMDVPLSDRIETGGEGRRKRLAPNAIEHVEAGYRSGWRQKVEKIGKLNFPELPKILGTELTLVLEVVINSDGTVREVEVTRSSGHPELDQRAKRIVYLGEPYAPLPEAIRAYTDHLEINNQWRFIPGMGMVQQ